MQFVELSRGYFLKMAGGTESARAQAGATALADATGRPRTSEFYGSCNRTVMLATKNDRSFYTIDQIAGVGEPAINASIPISKPEIMGVVQHRTKSSERVADVEAYRGGQVVMFTMELPEQAYDLSWLK